jgi:hypothetical protein
MSFTQKILIPLSDQVDTSLVGHDNVFEGEGDRIALKIDGSSDEFEIATEQDIKSGGDGAKSYDWNVLNSANADIIDVNITNSGRLTIDLNAVNSQYANAIFTAPFVYKNITGDFDVETLVISNADAISERAGLIVYDPAASAGEDWISVHSAFSGIGVKLQSMNTVNSSTAFLEISVSNLYLRIVRSGSSFSTYSKATAGAEWLLRATYTRADFGSSVQVGLIAAPFNTSNNFIAEYEYFRPKAYATSSPSPGAIWTAIPSVGAVVDMSTAKCWMFKDGAIQTAGNTDVKFKYAANNEVLSVSKTLTELRAESDPTIADAINSFKAVGVYASDGAYKSESSAWLEVNVIYPDGGGGLGIINGGVIGV